MSSKRLNKKEKVFIFGTGAAGRIAYRQMKSSYHILGFLDNDKSRHNSTLYRKTIFSPEILPRIEYDKILVASVYSGKIVVQLIQKMGIPSHKVEVSSFRINQQPGLWERLCPSRLKYSYKMTVDTDFYLSCKAADYYETLPVQNNLVMYESYNGREFGCNPMAILLYLLEHPDYRHLEHVIAVLEPSSTKLDQFRAHPRVTITRTHSDEYIRFAETCRYFFNNVSFQPYLIKNKGQIYITTWHSTLLKKLGYDTGRIWETQDTAKALLNCDYFISPNRFTTEKLLKSQGVGKIFKGTIIEVGYPRNDLTIKTDRKRIRKILNVPAGNRLMIFAPTWRGRISADNTVAETFEDYEQIRSQIPEDITVAMKFHSMVYPHLTPEDRQKCVPESVDTNELLAATDLLVTDYSGILYDYLLTEKPLILYTPDRTEYESMKKGFYLNLEDIPAPICHSIDELIEEIKNIETFHAMNKKKYLDFSRSFNHRNDGNACKRSIGIIFHNENNDDSYQLPTDDRTSILFYPGAMLPNGVTAAFLTLLDLIDHSRYKVTVVLPCSRTGQQYQCRINPAATVLYNTAVLGFTRAEYKKDQNFRFSGARSFSDIPMSAYQRNMRRIISDSTFDVAIDYSGYCPIWASMIRFGISASKHLIYMHNNLYEDMKIKQPQLKSVFSLYRFFDTIMCVSADSLRQNSDGAGKYILQTFGYDITPMMDFTHNLINPEKIKVLARNKPIFSEGSSVMYKVENRISASPDDTYSYNIPAPNSKNTNFITIGRLSPEKNHERMLHALKMVLHKYHDTRLYLIGQGVLQEKLLSLCDTLNIADNIIFASHISNPFPLVDMCDCFVLSSDIEGQAVTILEALALNKPVIATDIPGTRSMLKNGSGVLVPRNPESLAAAMCDFIDKQGQLNLEPFDAEKYVREGMRMYEEKAFNCLMRSTPT